MDPSEIKKELEAIAAKRAALRVEQDKMEELERAFALVANHLAGKEDAATPQSPPVRPRSLFEKMNQERELRKKPQSQEKLLPGLSAGKSKASVIREAFRKWQGNFTASDIYGDIMAKGAIGISKNDVSFALSRMSKAGQVVTVKQGAGKAPSIYANAQNGKRPDDDDGL